MIDLRKGDCYKLIKDIPNKSIDLVYIDIPYMIVNGGKANRLQEMSQVVIADVYIMSHTHTPMSMKQQIWLPDYANNSLNKKEMYYLISNSFLEPEGYGEKLGMIPVSNTITEIELDGTKRKIKTIL